MSNNQPQYVFSFDKGDGKNKQLLGGKGANLCEMFQIGLNVPPGFVISTEACLDYLERDQLPDGLMDTIRAEMQALEKTTGKGFGFGDNPLLVSVRSGAAMSMPGMMDTILNLGLNRETLASVIRETGDERFGYDAYRRFIQLFGQIALHIPGELFDEPFEAIKKREGAMEDVALTADNLKEISNLFLRWCMATPAIRSPKTPMRSLNSPSGPFSAHGTAGAPGITAASSILRRTWPTARPSVSAPWYSATGATTRPPA